MVKIEAAMTRMRVMASFNCRLGESFSRGFASYCAGAEGAPPRVERASAVVVFIFNFLIERSVKKKTKGDWVFPGIGAVVSSVSLLNWGGGKLVNQYYI